MSTAGTCFRCAVKIGAFAIKGTWMSSPTSFRWPPFPGRDAPATPVSLQVRMKDFLTQPSWAVLARLDKAPAQSLLPLGKRMGLVVPDGTGADRHTGPALLANPITMA